MSKMTLLKMMPIISEKLSNGETVSFTPSGDSMEPFLSDKACTVTLKKAPNALEKFDIALFWYNENTLVLHRVIEVLDGAYDFCGDNRFVPEKNISHKNIIGVVCAAEKNGEKIPLCGEEYQKYCENLGKVRKKLERKAYRAKYKRKIKNVIRKIFK